MMKVTVRTTGKQHREETVPNRRAIFKLMLNNPDIERVYVNNGGEDPEILEDADVFKYIRWDGMWVRLNQPSPEFLDSCR